MKTPNHILIHQLKQQQRLGVTPEQKDQYNQLSTILGGLNTTLTDFAESSISSTGEIAKLSDGVGRARGLFDEFSKVAETAAKSVGAIFEASKDLSTEFGMSSKSAFNFAKQLRGIDVVLGDKKLQQYAASLGKITGGFITAGKVSKNVVKELIKTQKFLQTNLALTAEQSEKFESYAAGLGRTGAQSIAMISEVAGTFSDALDMDKTQIISQITSDIADMGADTVAQFGRIPGQLEQATMKARLLGTTMADLNKSGESMLNIESSIGAEFEYQQLTGKRMLTREGKSLTNAFRMAQLQGNGVKQAELMQQYLEDHSTELDNNVLARKKAAEIFGTDAASLMEMKNTLAMTKRLGVDELITKAKGDLNKLEASLISSGKVGEAEIQKIMDAADVRTPAQKQLEKLDSIDKNIIKQGQEAIGTGKQALAGVNAELDKTFNVLKGIGGTLAQGAAVKVLGSVGVFIDKLALAGPVLGKITKIAGAITGGGVQGILPTFSQPVAKASGGYISGAGTGTSDSIPARLSDGEYVINAASTRRNRGLLDKINNTPVSMANGGAVTSMAETNSLLRIIAGRLSAGNVMGETAMNGRKRI